ncbi:MAG: endonuclease NucS [Clostridia bacterium]|nr:endonuclease NucS [Clostridia bacterium]
MSKLTNEELWDLYTKTFPPEMSFYDASEALCSMKGEYVEELRHKFCDLSLDALIRGYFMWDEDCGEAREDSLMALFIKQAELLQPQYSFFQAVIAFVKKEYSECLKLLDDIYLVEETEEIIYIAEDIGFELLSVFKNAFPGFWNHVREIFSTRKTAPGLFEMIDAIEAFYEIDNSDIVIDKLSKVVQIDSNCVTAKELLAFAYSKNKMWYNAIALYEQIEEPIILWDSDLYFNMAWAYEKIKDYNEAEKYYKKCLKISSDYTFATNNLGYIYIKKKEFSKAITTLKKCLKKEFSLDERKLASNNIVSAYIGSNQIDEAEKFISQSKIKLWKGTLNKFNSARNKKRNINENYIEECAENQIIASKKIDFSEKTYQFSSEKILEDELTMRIEGGQPVFGKKLKIYRRKGEYGRQYIFEEGRLDLLTEDENGDLYIIELKKDSGYDDAYKQTVEYIDWFTKHKAQDNRKVYGIICLNNPTEALIESVKNDDRIRLFEYQISYNEIS